jgi:hypothetical protein
MAENKTKATAQSVSAFLDEKCDAARRADCDTILKMMQKATGEKPKMWGSSIIGFGSYHYKYESGREGEMCLIGFSPRKTEIVLYIVDGFTGYDAQLKKLGKHKTGKSCLYIKRLVDVDLGVLENMIEASVAHMRALYARD